MDECHCGKDGHALNSINCPVHGIHRASDDGFKMVAGKGARLKRQQLEREICSLPHDSALRANLLHTFSKLFMFLEEDIRAALRIAGRNPYPK